MLGAPTLHGDAPRRRSLPWIARALGIALLAHAVVQVVLRVRVLARGELIVPLGAGDPIEMWSLEAVGLVLAGSFLVRGHRRAAWLAACVLLLSVARVLDTNTGDLARWRTQDPSFHAAVATSWLAWPLEAGILAALPLALAALAWHQRRIASLGTPPQPHGMPVRYRIAAVPVGIAFLIALVRFFLLPWSSRFTEPPLARHFVDLTEQLVFMLVTAVLWTGLRRGSAPALYAVAALLIAVPTYRLAAWAIGAPWLDPIERVNLATNAAIGVPFLLAGLALIVPAVPRTPAITAP